MSVLCFLLFLYFRKVAKEIFSELDEKKPKSTFYRNKDEVRRRVEETQKGAQTTPRRGLDPTRA
jgi:hypothetical protein